MATAARSARTSRFRSELLRYFEADGAESRREIARRAGISHVYLMAIMKGEHDPTLSVADEIASALGRSLHDMI